MVESDVYIYIIGLYGSDNFPIVFLMHYLVGILVGLTGHNFINYVKKN